jgi:ferric-dicitrate binding protein FerR (iron transport regulator)
MGMFFRHVRNDLSAYCHGELSAPATKRVAEHLIRCNSCRSEYELIKRAAALAEHLPQFSAPDNLWDNIQSASLHSESDPKHSGRPAIFRPQFAVIAASLILVTLVLVWFYLRETRPFWEVATLDGRPQIGKRGITNKGKLTLGQWLETDGSSRAQIDVSTIGQVEIDPNTRVRLVETRATEHRLELARGKLSAHIWAPPKLFFVDTPSAVAADLGCSYTLEVDDHGASLLRVTTGWVALQLKDRESMVPAGAACATRVGVGPGTPYFEDASPEFRDALRKLDFETGSSNIAENLRVLLTESRVRDTLTLWHLLARVSGEDRVRVYERMVQLSPPPDGVSREAVLALNQQSLDAWRDNLSRTWGDYSSPGMKALKKMWTTGLGKWNGLEGKR